MRDRLAAYVGQLQTRIELMRARSFVSEEERAACDAIADRLEGVVRDLTEMLESAPGARSE